LSSLPPQPAAISKAVTPAARAKVRLYMCLFLRERSRLPGVNAFGSAGRFTDPAGLAHAALPVDDSVLAARRNPLDQLADLWDATAEV
jgi:hypothetical protein